MDAKAIAAAKKDQKFAEGITEEQLSMARGDVKLIDEEIKGIKMQLDFEEQINSFAKNINYKGDN